MRFIGPDCFLTKYVKGICEKTCITSRIFSHHKRITNASQIICVPAHPEVAQSVLLCHRSAWAPDIAGDLGIWRDLFLEVRILPSPPFAMNKEPPFRPEAVRVLCRPPSLPDRNMTGAPVFWATMVSGSEQVNMQQTWREDCFLAICKF